MLTGQLKPARVFPETENLAARRRALACFIDAMTPRGGCMFGDLTKGGRPATADEAVMLEGTQPNGVPRGLARCASCAEWRGRCLDPSPHFAGQVMDVYCRCGNDSRCAACQGPLNERKVNANYFDETDGHIWHVPGFSALSHVCEGAQA